MGYAIGAIVLFNLFVFAFKAWDKSREKSMFEDIIEQGRSQIKKNQQAFGPLVYPVRFVKSLIRKGHGHH